MMSISSVSGSCKLIQHLVIYQKSLNVHVNAMLIVTYVSEGAFFLSGSDHAMLMVLAVALALGGERPSGVAMAVVTMVAGLLVQPTTVHTPLCTLYLVNGLSAVLFGPSDPSPNVTTFLLPLYC